MSAVIFRSRALAGVGSWCIHCHGPVLVGKQGDLWHGPARAGTWVYTDGGRREAGFEGETGDCVARAIALATRIPYRDVHILVDAFGRREKGPGAVGWTSSADGGVKKPTTGRILATLGWAWQSMVPPGGGAPRARLRPDLLPSGVVICKTARHVVAVIDGVTHDSYDSTRGGRTPVYGYWTKPAGPVA